MFALIRPNVNWHNQNNWVSSKQLFRPCFQQVHVSVVSSDIGLEPQFAQRNLIGRSAILTFGLWAFKVSAALPNESEYGTFSMTMIQGKHHKKITFISAYIAVERGQTLAQSLFTPRKLRFRKREF
jgi:hypothetical protein